jgi:hypothetical protein
MFCTGGNMMFLTYCDDNCLVFFSCTVLFFCTVLSHFFNKLFSHSWLSPVFALRTRSSFFSFLHFFYSPHILFPKSIVRFSESSHLFHTSKCCFKNTPESNPIVSKTHRISLKHTAFSFDDRNNEPD